MDITELSSLHKLTESLSKEDIKQIHTALQVPDGICDRDCDGAHFFRSLKRWERFDAFLFYKTLKVMRPDLVQVALSIGWLCAEFPGTPVKQETTVKGLVLLLQSELSMKEIELIQTVSSSEESEVKFNNTMKLLLNKNVIQKDLIELMRLLNAIGKIELAARLEVYTKEFEVISDQEFLSKFRKELSRLGKQITDWESFVREYLETQFRKVKQMMGKDKPVSLEKVFVDLTIVKEEPRPISYEDETTYNEIAYLRKIANKEVEIIPIDFNEEMQSCDPSNPKIMCFIGNPGCGKTFLCNRTALRFGNNELSKFSYALAIPCRKTEWHEMESSRIDSGLPVTNEFICQWLCLGLPIGPRWTNELAKHITETNGEGMLLIIDSLDEFTKEVPFSKTLLHLLLTRQTLTRSYILLTSRPGAWTDISSKHTLSIDSYYQVLGFSPEQRDLYFEKQFDDVSLLKRCTGLLDRYDEMKQLSLIPVNASLFAALLKSEDGARIHTLTQLYYELALYLIRRQLSRMRLDEWAQATELSELDTNVLECLHSIGYFAYQGVAMREMISDKKVFLRVGKVLKECECLGLVHEHVKMLKMGVYTKVWSFSHLTFQEFTGAIWLSSTSWRDQCLSVRFIVHTKDVFALFRMVLRFLCGLLTDSDQSMNVYYLIIKHLTPRPVPINHLPDCVQLRFEHELTTLFGYTVWEEFTEMFYQLSTMLFESTSDSIPKYFNLCRRFLPNSVCFYIISPVTPNEWICFLQALTLFDNIHLIHVETQYVTPELMLELLESVKRCSVTTLAIRLPSKLVTNEYTQINKEVLDYVNAIQHIQLPRNIKLSLDMTYCVLTETETVQSLFTWTTNQILSGLSLYKTEFPPDSLSLLANQLSACQNLKYEHTNTSGSEVLLPALFSGLTTTSATHINPPRTNTKSGLYKTFKRLFVSDSKSNKNKQIIQTSQAIESPQFTSATHINGLHFYRIPTEYHQQFYSLLSTLPDIREISWLTSNGYSILPHINHCSNISYLRIQGYNLTRDINLSDSLLQLLHSNSHSIRVLELWHLKETGLSSLDGFLSCLQFCTNLVLLKLKFTYISCNDVTLWCSAVQGLSSLVYLEFIYVSLFDSEMLSLSRGLISHPNIRYLQVFRCKLSSNSCQTLTNLIPTLSQLKYLWVTDLSEPETEPIELLELTADHYGIGHALL